MGFVDVVGIATSHFKHDSQLSGTVANLLPMMVFLWFALCSIPSGIAMSRLGRRNTALLSMGIAAVAMLIPLIAYGYAELLIAFALLEIGKHNPAGFAQSDGRTSRLGTENGQRTDLGPVCESCFIVLGGGHRRCRRLVSLRLELDFRRLCRSHLIVGSLVVFLR